MFGKSWNCYVELFENILEIEASSHRCIEDKRKLCPGIASDQSKKYF